MSAWKTRVVIKPWPEGGYVAEAPSLQGCWVVGDTIEEALRDIVEGIEMSIESRLKRGELLPADLEEITAPTDGGSIALEVAVLAGDLR